ncbi:SigE family RNA polymerase sigma factor [Pedococcus sp. 2YAF34]|uniref:SigE family RNA polymerase sigma factor n=1 Tax=Pedococcus sp. 2YAF34 TaxID=3233032 RepID=UPI003F9A94FC
MDTDGEEEFRQFVQARWHSLVRTAFLLTGDQGRAEDLVQTVLVKVHRRWGHVAHAGSPYAYTRAALANESASWWRRRRVAETLGEVPAHADRARGDAYAAYDTRDEVARAVLALPPRMRAVVVLRYFDDLSEADTAEALGMSTGSVKSQASRGLERLRAVLQQTQGTAERSLS